MPIVFPSGALAQAPAGPAVQAPVTARADETPGPQQKEPSRMDATAKDVLTPNVVRVTADMEVGAVAQLFGNEAITGAPVVDGEGRVVGVISQSDLLGHVLTPAPAGRPPTTVRDIMTPMAVTVEEETPLDEVAARMAQYGIHRVVVVDQAQRVRGIVTSMDLVLWVAAQA